MQSFELVVGESHPDDDGNVPGFVDPAFPRLQPRRKLVTWRWRDETRLLHSAPVESDEDLDGPHPPGLGGVPGVPSTRIFCSSRSSPIVIGRSLIHWYADSAART